MATQWSSSMVAAGLIWMSVLSAFLCGIAVSGTPIGTSTVNCDFGSSADVGRVDESYTGVVEVLTGIQAGASVQLVPYLFPDHIKFLSLEFNVGDTSATVYTQKPLDADELQATSGKLYYSVMCVAVGKLNNTRTLNINDLNDNAPIFEERVYTKIIPEIWSEDTEVIKVKANDADVTTANNKITYSLMPPASSAFIVDAVGSVILKERLNYNLVKNYNLTIQAQDNLGLSDLTTVLIEVEDFDNLNPYFDHYFYQASIPENQTGPLVSIEPETIKAQDGDTGINVAVSYSISTVSPNKYLSNFNIDVTSGVISVATALDREEIEEVLLGIKAAQSDDSLKTASTLVSLTIEDVNDNPPAFDQESYTVYLQENSPVDTILFRASISDPDQGGFVGTLRLLPESVPFSVGPDGTITVKSSTDLDRETTGNFMFQIEATETADPKHITVADVNITLLDENDNSPQFERDRYEGKVPRDQAVGMLVVQVSAEDPDAGSNGQVEYSIDWGNEAGYFSINQNTGEITLNNTIPLVENKILEFSLYVSARDGGVVSRSSLVLVEVLAPGDSKPQFLQSTYSGSIDEEMEPGVVILKVGFLAITSEVPVTVTVLTDADKFNIDSNGVFTSKLKLDYETKHNYSVTISITDGTSTDEAVVEVEVIDINDNDPVFVRSPVTENVPEDTEIGANVTSVTATDADDGFNGEILYSLQGGEGKFSIDSDSGMVTIAGALDRETKTGYSLEVVARDQGRPSRSATSTLLITVEDVNDNNPTFSKTEYEVEVLETASVGTKLHTIEAKDLDEGTNGRVRYSISQQDPPSSPVVFEVNSSTGELLLAQPLDYGLVKGYILTVQASDGGTPSLAANASVVVKVKDVNNKPPQFSQDVYSVAVSENLASGASIVTLEVNDEDEGGFSNGHFIFTSDTFDINKQGVVSLKKDVVLDRETEDNYVLQVVAVDHPINGLNATAQLNITVLDYNDNNPQFAGLPDPFLITEGEYSVTFPGEVYRVVATDADIGPSGKVTLSTATPDALFNFREDGTLMVNGPLDRETRDAYELVIVASDDGTPRRENITTIRVSVTDLNDNTPVFSSTSYTKSLLVIDAKVGDVVLTLLGTDKDIGNNSLLTYSFLTGSSPYLTLNAETGVVSVASDLANVTEDTVLKLTAMVKDQGEPPLNSTATVQVSLKTVSLVDGTAFERSSYNFSLPENQPEGTHVGAVKASSGDAIYDVTYGLTTHTDLFAIDTSGALTSKAALDRETQEWYILEIEAVDTRTPPTSAIALVRVQVENVNEVPEFASQTYESEIFSIAPYKYPVVQVQATDPDTGDSGQLIYSLSATSDHFDVDGSTGLVYVVSAMGLAGDTSVDVKATDPDGLSATAVVKVKVQASDISSDVVVISVNKDIHLVKGKIPEIEESLGRALGWTVNVIGVASSSTGALGSRVWRDSIKTFVSIIATYDGIIISAEEVKKKLQSESSTVKMELEKVFGPGLEHDVEEDLNTSSQATVIALAVLLALSVVGLGVMVAVFVVKLRKNKNHKYDDDRESFNINTSSGYMNSERNNSASSKQGRASMKNDKPGQKNIDIDSDSGASHTSAL